MGDCVLVMEEGVPRMDSVASGTGSLVQIESIEIDLRSSMEPPKLERFSIRGFVADMRRKNRKACLPFGDADDRLPPMSVPSFRWWQCPTCVPDADAKGKMVVETASDGAGTDSLQNVGDEDCIILHSTENRDIGDCSIRGKAALDLSLNDNARRTEIPDLNEEPIEGNHFATLPEKSLPLHNTWDASLHCRNGTTSEGKRPLTISESENNEARRELEASDDIPMETVELLAKNQRERAVPFSQAVHVDSSPFWSFTRDPNSPFHLNIAPKHSIQPSSSSHHPKKQSFHNGNLFSQDRHSAGSNNASCSYRAQLVQEAGSSKASHLATSDSEFGVCTLNRNPADFSIPDARNEFTISAKDLKFRKRNNSKDKSVKGRQRMRS